MSTDAIEAANAIEKQLDAMKIVDENTAENGDAKAGQAKMSTKPHRRFRNNNHNDEERRRKWEESQKNKEVLETGLKGKVKWYSIIGHYGFIAREDGKGDIFVHQTAISKSKTEKYFLRTLADDEDVEFDVVQGKKGLEASNVTGPDGTEVRGAKAYRIQLRRPFRKSPKKSTEETAGPKKVAENGDKPATEDTDKPPRRNRKNRRARKPKVADEKPEDVSSSENEKNDDHIIPKSVDEKTIISTNENGAGDIGLGSDAIAVAAQL